MPHIKTLYVNVYVTTRQVLITQPEVFFFFLLYLRNWEYTINTDIKGALSDTFYNGLESNDSWLRIRTHDTTDTTDNADLHHFELIVLVLKTKTKTMFRL